MTFNLAGLFLLTSLKCSFLWLFISAMSLKEAGKLLESKVYDTLQLQVNNFTWLHGSFILFYRPDLHV